MDKIIHTSVMLSEVIENLNLREDSIVVDCTTGEGGHSEAILEKIPRGRLICIDRNADILAKATERLKNFSNVSFFHTPFDRIDEVLDLAGVEKADGILADLGISMFHLKTESLGFSYTDKDSLDMRLDDENPLSAADVVNRMREKELADLIYEFGEERESRQIANAIVRNRPISSAFELSELIRRVKRPSKSRIHPATKTFQALRIFVNKELEKIESFIPLSADKLTDGGRLVIISFHSLEDRRVKWGFRALKEQGKGEILTKKPLIAAENEMKQNPASRSAKLRVFKRRI